MKKKHIALLLTCVMLMGVAIGGTLAWLTDSTEDVTNVFTTSDINIELDETENLNLQMIPGWDIAKDPKVTVKANSEDCYVFVKIDKSANYSSYLKDYEVRTGWTKLTDDDATDAIAVAGENYDVYYRVVNKQASDWSDYILGAGTGDFANGYVSVKGTVTKSMMEDIDGVVNGSATADEEIAARPTLIFTAYASQLKENNADNFSPYEAWVNIFPANP